jgi:hypothetical protein
MTLSPGSLRFLIVLCLALAIWWPTQNLPYYWDSALFVLPASRHLLSTRFQPLIAIGHDFPHPPLFFLLHALTLLRPSLLTAHLLILPFLILYLWSVFLLAHSLFRRSAFAFIALLLIALTPFVLAEAGQVYLDLPAAALSLASLAALVFRRRPLAVLFLSLATLTKLTALLFLPALLYLDGFQNPSRPSLSRFKPWLLPPALCFVWLLYHHQITGWWLFAPDRPAYVPHHFSRLFASAQTVLSTLFLSQNRLALSLLASLSLLKKPLAYLTPPPLLKTGLIALITTLLFYTLFGEINARYLLSVYPLFLLLSLYLLRRLHPHPLFLPAAALLIGFLFIQAWHPPAPPGQTYQLKHFEDLRYLDVIALGRQTSAYLEVHFPQALIVGTYPESYQLSDPLAGYVARPLAFTYCRHYRPEPGRSAILVRHSLSPLQPECASLLQSTKSPQPHRQFNARGLTAHIYLLSQP